MLQLVTLAALLLSAAGAGAQPVQPARVSVEVNNYVDILLGTLQPIIRQQNLDPLPLPNQSVGFSKKIGFVRFSGSASLTDGSVSGLSSVRRYGDWSIGFKSSRVSIVGGIGVRNVSGRMKGSAKFMKIKVGSISASIKVSKIDMRATISADVRTGDNPRLDSFSITTFSGISVSVSGLGPLNWILSKVVNAINSLANKAIRSAIEKPIRSLLEKQLSKVKFPKLVPGV